MAALKPFLATPVTERFGKPPYPNCNFAAGLTLANKATHNKKGRAGKTVVALRKASGATHAATGPTELIAAFKKLWGWHVAEWTMSWNTLLARLRQISHYGGAVVYIYPSKLPEHFRRWDINFSQGHAVYIQGTAPSGGHSVDHIWLIDPMIVGWEKGYRGEWIEQSVLQKALQSVNPVLLNQDQFV